MHRILSDLTPLLDGVGWKRTVLGGDLNVSTQTDGAQRGRDATVFARLAALGLVDLLAENKPRRPTLVDCWCDDAGTDRCRHVHTHYHSKSKQPWNNDYLFASHELAERLDSCELVPGFDAELSDHHPVIARFSDG
jgi:exonuclease III